MSVTGEEYPYEPTVDGIIGAHDELYQADQAYFERCQSFFHEPDIKHRDILAETAQGQFYAARRLILMMSGDGANPTKESVWESTQLLKQNDTARSAFLNDLTKSNVFFPLSFDFDELRQTLESVAEEDAQTCSAALKDMTFYTIEMWEKSITADTITFIGETGLKPAGTREKILLFTKENALPFALDIAKITAGTALASLLTRRLGRKA